jgi:uncharacterized protein (TIGR00375 family)
MRQILDAHIHSRYSRACSHNLTLPHIEQACLVKGINIIATGDFTHPQWFLHIQKELEESALGSGLYVRKNSSEKKVKFILSAEVALIYKDNGKCRRLHLLLLAPSIEAVRRLNETLEKKYNLRADGRPILGISAPDIVKICLDIDEKFLIFPAHIWTPWFAVFGSKSGFDSLSDCFHDQTKNIFAYETGLSSDPEMNWRLSLLDNLTCLSSSDAHSLPNIGREATVLELENITYDEIYEAVKNNDKEKIKYTIEFHPEEGMYHFDGHRDCHFSCSPTDSKKHQNICPVCKKQLPLGVAHRVDELADRPLGFVPENAVPFKKLVGLDKIIAEALDVKSRSSLKVQKEYNKLIKKYDNELNILLDVEINDLEKNTLPLIATGIDRMRKNDLIVAPGYDGEYGKVNIFSEEEKRNKENKTFSKTPKK